MVSVKVQMRDGPDRATMIATSIRVEAELERRFPQVRWSFFEPDISD